MSNLPWTSWQKIKIWNVLTLCQCIYALYLDVDVTYPAYYVISFAILYFTNSMGTMNYGTWMSQKHVAGDTLANCIDQCHSFHVNSLQLNCSMMLHVVPYQVSKVKKMEWPWRYPKAQECCVQPTCEKKCHWNQQLGFKASSMICMQTWVPNARWIHSWGFSLASRNLSAGGVNEN